MHKSCTLDEPITKTFRDKSLQSKEELKFWDQALYHDPIQDGVSLIVVDPGKGNSVIGMRISSIKSKTNNNEKDDSAEEEEEPDFSKFSFYTQFVFHALDLAATAEVNDIERIRTNKKDVTSGSVWRACADEQVVLHDHDDCQPRLQRTRNCITVG